MSTLPKDARAAEAARIAKRLRGLAFFPGEVQHTWQRSWKRRFGPFERHERWLWSWFVRYRDDGRFDLERVPHFWWPHHARKWTFDDLPSLVAGVEEDLHKSRSRGRFNAPECSRSAP